MKKIVYCFLGCVCFALGGIGAALPILPTFPFLLLAAFCFARSSERLHAWFQETKLYKENLEDYVAGNGMRKQAKIRIMCTVTVLMSIGFILMSSKGVYIACIARSFIVGIPSGRNFPFFFLIFTRFKGCGL